MTSLPYLTSDFAGIGGTIKNRAEDFFVQEQPLYEPSGEGEHVYVEIQKIGITTFEAIHRLARALRVHQKDIGYAGLKDAHAVTRQVFSIAGTSEPAVMNAFLRDMTVQWAARHRNKLRLGHLAGNRFAVKIRDVKPTDVIKLRPVLSDLGRRGMPNYFGEQRFGRNGNNHLLGAALIAGNDETVLRLLLGTAFDTNELPPGQHGLEHRVLQRLIKTQNPAAAVGAVDEKIRRLWVSALQSSVFNEVVTARIGSLDRLMDGDMAYIHENGACFRVVSADVEQSRCASFEISPTGPMPGGRMDWPEGRPLEIERDAMSHVGVTPEMFDTGRRIDARGARRPLRVRPTDTSLEGGVDEHGSYITVAFNLPAGAYATVLLRELMKTDLLSQPTPPGGDEGSNAQEDEQPAEDGHDAEAGSGE